MNPDLVPWVTAFCCISLIFVTLAFILFCVFAEKYNVHQARSEKGGHLQVNKESNQNYLLSIAWNLCLYSYP